MRPGKPQEGYEAFFFLKIANTGTQLAWPTHITGSDLDRAAWWPIFWFEVNFILNVGNKCRQSVWHVESRVQYSTSLLCTCTHNWKEISSKIEHVFLLGLLRAVSLVSKRLFFNTTWQPVQRPFCSRENVLRKSHQGAGVVGRDEHLWRFNIPLQKNTWYTLFRCMYCTALISYYYCSLSRT